MLDLVEGNYALLSLAAACGLYTLYRKYSRISISDVPGPGSKTFLLGVSHGFTQLREYQLTWRIGHSKELLLSDCGTTEAEFRQKYGDVVRAKGALGVRCLFRSSLLDDPDDRIGGRTMGRRSQSDQAYSPQVWL